MRRRVARFRRAGLFSGCGSEVTIQRASDASLLRQAYALVHDVFVNQGFISSHPSHVRLRTYEALPEMATFVATVDGHVVAVTSVVPDSSDLGLPSDQAFNGELDILRAEGRRLCEITNLAVNPAYRNTPIFFELTRCCLAHATLTGHTDMFIAISPEHARFFEEVLLFDHVGDEREYEPGTEDIVEGKRLNLVGLQQRAKARDLILAEEHILNNFFYVQNPYHALVAGWDMQARSFFFEPSLLVELFAETGFLGECSLDAMESIGSRWGKERLAEVRRGARRVVIPMPKVGQAHANQPQIQPRRRAKSA
ncbi:MAG: hypothetical protein FWE88_02685 [Phycisphaerae bacterium]|nr:hypothetical protein [Phycisphaerae bacterium]